MLKPIMFVGTASDVGKSVITTGFCRVFKQDGYQPAPFKAQNMSLNSYATPEGLEIGKAQAIQAEACGIPCTTDMNPVLLKPFNNNESQVILNGKSIESRIANEYYSSEGKDKFFAQVTQAYDRLMTKHNPVVIEGAGSIAELNIRDRDIANMKMALHSGAATFLIADIEKGGVFGSLFGTLSLLLPKERKLIRGIIINKFRGDTSLFNDGRKIIEDICNVPIIGILPYFKDIDIEEEDSAGIKKKNNKPTKGKVNIAVILFDRISNFTDFARLEKDFRINLFYTSNPDDIEQSDIIILPGSKNTIGDLINIKNSGMAKAIYFAHKMGKKVIGICGGYQMMGESISDPLRIESNVAEITGLGILPIQTTLLRDKITKQRTFTYKNYPDKCLGYEIHLGETIHKGISKPVNLLEHGGHEGYYLNDKSWGTYLHGILDNRVVIEDIIAEFTDTKNEYLEYVDYKEQQYDKLAHWIRGNIDLNHIYRVLKT